MNIGTLLPRHARYRGEHSALIVGNERLTFAELNRRVNQLANGLLSAGITKGEKIATILPNCLELMLAYWAAAKTGIVIVPGSTLLLPNGLTNLLNDSDTRLVIADSSFAITLTQIQIDLPDIEPGRIFLVGSSNGVGLGFSLYENLIQDQPEREPPNANLVDSDVYNIMYSSGTTGAPKGIIHTHYIRAMYCTLFASAWRMTPESVVLHAGAIVFNGAMLDLMPWMFVGCTYILHPIFNPERFIQTIKNENVTHIILVPSQIISLLEHPEFTAEAMTSLEMIQNVGAPLHIEHKHRLNDLLPGRFYELYGVTEGFATILDKHDALRKVGSVGVPPAFYEMRILDEQGEECATGAIGEICGKGPLLMTGYYKRDDLTHEALIDGWLHTGDAGYVDEEGYLFLVDRMKDMIISGGVNVYPKDIEEIIVRHLAIREVAVFGATNEKWGEVPVAAVLLRDGAFISSEDLKEWTNTRVDAKFQRISDVIILESFPYNLAGKILKRELREQYTQK